MRYFLLAAIASLVGCSVMPMAAIAQSFEFESSSEEIPGESLLTVLASRSDSFSILAVAVDAAGLTPQLATSGPYTVLAPTDEAFAELPPEVIELLLRPENRTLLREVLVEHIQPTAIEGSGVQTVGFPLVNAANTIPIQRLILLEEANVVETLTASNGFIHVIDRVLLSEATRQRILLLLIEQQLQHLPPQSE